jgi:MoaA/NifB/PqqE/SkfB family radical SAM enzyme
MQCTIIQLIKHMKPRRCNDILVDDQGRLIIPKELADHFGLAPGGSVPATEFRDGLLLGRPSAQLARLYIEPTNRCNLSCRTCIRNTWDETLGLMTAEIFSAALQGLRDMGSGASVFFGGLGEPLAHPDILDMVSQACSVSPHVELITNGMLLNQAIAAGLIEAGLEVLWVSIDGAHPESYADVRLGAALPSVLENVSRFRDMRPAAAPHIGIVFVAMRRNIAELPEVLRIGRRLGADRFMITNIMPYAPEMRDELLYGDALAADSADPSPLSPHLYVPAMDITDATGGVLRQVLRTLPAQNPGGAAQTRACPFIERGSCAIAWDGSVCPCIPLMHSHMSFLNDRERFMQRCVMGSLANQPLKDIWRSQEYVRLREKLRAFDFSPCVFCGGCHLSKDNSEDCFGNTFPACGGCLWAQRIIQCP